MMMGMGMGGPAKTNLGGFKGFGLGAKKDGASGGLQAPKPKPGLNARKPGASSSSSGVSSLFAESLEDEGKRKPSATPSWSKPTVEAVKAQRDAEVLLAQDPTVFQYDEVIDEIKDELNEGGGSQAVRTDVNTQKKRVGLTLPEDCQVRTGTKRAAKYIERVMLATDRRKVEAQIIEDRLLKKEKDARKDAEVFVTEAFKEELKKRQKFVDELEAQEARDEHKAAEKQEFGTGFADMYRNLLNGGLASGRGGTKVKELAPALEESKEEPKEVLKEELKEEEEVESMVEEKKLKGEVLKEEADAEASFGVLDASVQEPASAKAARKAKEEEGRAEKKLSAKERFMARKKAEAASAAAR